ncbi:unnamed protein product [Nezara viridula]|uniref:DNA 3'-5' helicase n=1 Tax=Nezara viridula TaxID=85310 RepID=A0A9P0E3D4_NEZVI|nr:unnamed protein product [Nezara viridula]
MDSIQKLKYEKSKYVLKKWESEFKKTTEKLPTKSDIKCAPKKIKDAYKTYWTLKKYLSGSEKTYNIHEDENAKDCFNSSSETGDKDISFKNDSNMTTTDGTIGLDDSICFRAVSETLTQSSFNFAFQNEKENVCKKSPVKSDSFTETTLENEIKNKNVSELTPTSFKNLFSKQNRPCVADPSFIEKVDFKKSEKKEIKKFEAKSLSFQYAEKLYAGSKFNKRNPRKPRSFVNSKNAEDVEKNLVVSKISNNSISKSEIDCGTLLHKDNHVSVYPQSESLSSPTEEDNGTLEFKEKFKIVTQSSKLSNQPVSLLQRSVDSCNTLQHSVSRIVDKGWLERVNESNIVNKKLENNLAESQDSGISSIKTDSLSDTINIVSPESKSFIDDDNSEDLIYDSDCETQSNSVYKLNLLDNLNRSIDIGVPKTFTKQLISDDFAKSSDKLENIIPKPIKNHSIGGGSVNKSHETFIIDKKRSLIYDLDDVPLAKRLKSDTEYSFQSVTKPEIILPYRNSKNKVIAEDENIDHKQKMLEKKIASGDANKNFVKINIEKKRYARGKKTITFSKYKKQKWKDMQKYNSSRNGGIIKCYKCGDVGHFSKACPKKINALLPIDEYDSADESPFPTLEEAAEMAKEAAETAHKHGRKFTVSEGAVSVIPVISEPCYSTTIEPLFKLSSDGSLIDTPKEVYSALKDLGHSEFRPGQEEGIMRILSGLSTIVTLSTGSGKSLIYQLPAYMYNKAYPGCITLVISPLVSLMEDQIFCGSKKLNAACLHHNMTQKKREVVLEALKNQTISVLLIAPESLSSWDSAKSLLKTLPPIAFACIDEAHSISQHSHNFRPTYLTICQDTGAPNKKGRLSIHAEAYHAGLTAGRRNQVQSAFMSGKLRIVVATVAFGMGINKNDIRGIIHYNMPFSFESYVQEIGRAGRDKKPAQCHLFLDSKVNYW